MALKASEQNGNLVLPGERLGVIEEFIPDSGTYVKDGVIYSKIVGRDLMDVLNKRVSVYPLINGAVVPRVGTIVVGQCGNASLKRIGPHIEVGAKKKILVFLAAYCTSQMSQITIPPQ
jgi:exosome complex component CSL4